MAEGGKKQKNHSWSQTLQTECKSIESEMRYRSRFHAQSHKCLATTAESKDLQNYDAQNQTAKALPSITSGQTALPVEVGSVEMADKPSGAKGSSNPQNRYRYLVPWIKYN